MTSDTAARWLLILGVAFVFLFFGIDKFLNPLVWTGWMPLWLDGLAGYPKETWLQVVAVSEIILGAMILIPVRLIQKTGALLASIHLLGIISQVGWNDIAVRDIGLLVMTTALLLLL